MPKDYAKLINKGLQSLRVEEEAEADSRFLNESSEPEEVGVIFQMVSDRVGFIAEKDDPTVRLFAEAGLDPYNPFHWDNLLAELAKIHYSTRAPHRPKVQLADFAEQLKRDCMKVLACRKKKPNGLEFAKLFLEQHGKEYGSITSTSGITSVLKRHGVSIDELWERKQRKTNDQD
jgi:hypothetical protein